MFKKVLLCTDGSEYSQIAMETAFYLARKFSADVDALHVIENKVLDGPLFADLSGAFGATPYQDFYSQLKELYEQRAKTTLDLVEKTAHSVFVKCDTFREQGVLAEVVARYEANADLVVLGRNGENARHRSDLIGHSVEDILRRSSKPCLITLNRFHEFKKAVIAFDGSENSRHALRAGLELSKNLPLALTLIAVDTGNPEAASDALAYAVREAQKAGVPVDEQVLTGNADDEITGYCKKRGVDLIIMGAYGHTRIREFILGSTTNSVLIKSPVPVMLVR
ncbi:MAG: universal stress protein [Verrucomicrobiae bacterium]|nr:universal stress protein [Verrucomicrobiae bacterium]